MRRSPLKRTRARASNRGPFVRAVCLVKDRIPDVARYLFSLPAVRSLLRELELHPKVTFFIGENGSGKSTLVETIALAAVGSSFERRATSMWPRRSTATDRAKRSRSCTERGGQALSSLRWTPLFGQYVAVF